MTASELGTRGGPADPVSEATRRCDGLRRRLEGLVGEHAGGASEEERAALRAEITALIRAVDAQAQAWRALADAARALPDLWKQIPRGAPHASATTPDPAAPPRAPPGATAPAPVNVSTRSDHLGASTFVAKGWSAYAAGDFEASEAAFERATALAPDDDEAAALLAWARAARGRDDEALLAAQRVLVARPRGAAASLARVAVGRVCLAKGVDGEAVEHLSRVVRDDDDRRAALYATFYLGVAYRRRGLFADSAAYLERALALGPNLVEARYELGCTHWRAGAREEACAAWRAGAAGTFGPWVRRCAERLAEVERGERVGA